MCLNELTLLVHGVNAITAWWTDRRWTDGRINGWWIQALCRTKCTDESVDDLFESLAEFDKTSARLGLFRPANLIGFVKLLLHPRDRHLHWRRGHTHSSARGSMEIRRTRTDAMPPGRSVFLAQTASGDKSHHNVHVKEEFLHFPFS